MRELTGGQAQVQVSGSTVRQVVDNLEAAHPGMKALLCDGDELGPHVAVVVDGQLSRLRLNQPVEDGGQVRFVPVMHGG
jgi:sulfur-carrier protein